MNVHQPEHVEKKARQLPDLLLNHGPSFANETAQKGPDLFQYLFAGALCGTLFGMLLGAVLYSLGKH